MKKASFKKLVTSLLLVVVAVAFLVPTVFSTTAYAAGSNIMGSYERDALEEADYNRLVTQIIVDDSINKWAEERKAEEEKTEKSYDEAIKKEESKDEDSSGDNLPEDKKEKKKKKIDKTVEVLRFANQKVPEVVSFIKGIQNGGDFDTAELAKNILSTASGIANCIPPWGPIVGAAIEIFSSIFFAAMGGEGPPSEIALMEDSINQKFDKLSSQIAGLEEQIGDLSDQVNESTNKIINEMSVALEIAAAQETLKEFYLSDGTDDFSYNQYRNYVYGTPKNNSSATTAYYNLLMHAAFEGGSPEEVKYYYDMLYSAMVNNRDTFRDYVIGNSTGKSIVQYYYDVLKARPEYAAKMGVSAELAAIQFAYDLYQTQILTDEIMLVCNNYQYTQILLNCTCEEKCSCSYDYGTGKIWRTQLEGDDSVDSIYEQILLREEELTNQFARDIVYVLNTNRTYTMEKEGKLYSLNTEEKDGITYGKAPLNCKVYLNRIPNEVCELFDIDPSDFAYEGENVYNADGVFQMNSQQSQVLLTYKGETINSIYFIDAAAYAFSGGSGTAEDPYLISTPEQFYQINDGMDKYYRLMNDIDFREFKLNGEDPYPLGRKILSPGSVKYEEFNGILDGNGHTISNLTIVGDDYSGVFGKIGASGVVKNITFDSIKIKTSGNCSAKDSIYSFYAGVVAGDNHGIIRNCYVRKIDVNLVSSTSNEGAERSVYFHVGAIAGRNCGTIQFVDISKTDVSADSTHDMKGASISANKNIVYVGGVCGYNYGNIDCAVVGEGVSVIAKAKTISNHDTKKSPYATALAGGITAKNKDEELSNIKNVYSEAETNGSVVLDCQSGWGEWYGNVVQGDGEKSYIPKIPKESVGKIRADADDIKAAFPQYHDTVVVCEDKTPFYKVGDKSLNLENLNLTVNGKSVEYEILSVYGFDTSKASENMNVTVLFAAYIGQTTQRIVAEFPVSVVDYIVGISVSGIELEYSKNATLPNSVTVIQHYASGMDVLVDNVKFNVENKDTITKKYGAQDITFVYNGFECIIQINVICSHSSNYDFGNEALYNFVKTVKATCKNIGYDEYECLECGELLKTNYKRKTDHKAIEYVSEDVSEDVSEKATCNSEGKIGRIYCEFCNKTLAEAVDIPMLPHSIIKVTDTTSANLPKDSEHYCENGKHWIPHDFYVTESYENDGIIYTYICKSCGYEKEEKDTNIITNSARKQPMVVVSDGYALAGGDLVTVYVQLVNNPGVYGADFGIRYDERLTLVKLTDGMLFEKIFAQADGIVKFKDSAKATSCGYNFVWGIGTARDPQGNLICPDGNLVKLVFKLPDDAKVTDKFNVSVVYSQVDDLKSGFVVDTKVCNEQNISTSSPQQFITKDGVIQLVDHLPGDINSDKCVDILDVVYLANYLAKHDYTQLENIKVYGDVNLSGGTPDVKDAAIILSSLTGGYGEDGNLLYHQYQIAFNTNGYHNLPSHFVDLYGENNTYASILSSFDELMYSREGYKFLGWYTRLADGKEIDVTQNIKYDTDQKIQTLYAHWEKNSVSFKDSESNDYESDYIVNGIVSAPEESYAVTFYHPDDNKGISELGYLVREFGYWLGSDGGHYYDGQALDVSEAGMGRLTLTAVWAGWKLDAPTFSVDGYDSNCVQWFVDKGTNQSIADFGYGNFAKRDIKELYGKWTSPLTYSIEYQLNGGSFGASHPDSAIYDESFTVSNPGRLGYTFAGWKVTGMDNTEHWHWSTINGDFVSDKNNSWDFASDDKKSSWNGLNELQFINLHANSGTVTFTAQWVANTYSIDYSVNGGKDGASHPTIATFDSQFVVDNPTRIGYTFTGWTIMGMDDAEHYFGSQSTNETRLENVLETTFKNLHSKDGTVRFVANWKANTYSVSYKYNPSTGVSETEGGNVLKGSFGGTNLLKNVTYGTKASLGIAKAITYEEYYEFLGWYTESGIQITDSNGNPVKSNVNGYIDNNGNWCFTSGITLVAHYRQNYKEMPYEIETSDCENYVYIEREDEFKSIFGNESALSGKYILIADIDLGEISPIGTHCWNHIVSHSQTDHYKNISSVFSGEFCGGGNTITYSITINKDSVDKEHWYSLALFGSAQYAKFSNIKLSAIVWNSNTSYDTNSHQCIMAGLVGSARNCEFYNVEVLQDSLIWNYETDHVYKGISIGTLYYAAATYAGGVVGEANGCKFYGCHNYGIVNSTGWAAYAGGIAGNAYNCTFDAECTSASGKVTADKFGKRDYAWNSAECASGDLYGKNTHPCLKLNGKDQVDY